MTTNDIEQLRADAAQTHADLVAAIRASWECCERYYDHEHRMGSGGNLPESIREALEEVAKDVGGTEGLVRHRPGSWEADLIRHLAAMADWVDDAPDPGPSV